MNLSKKNIFFAVGLCAVLIAAPLSFGAGASFLADAIQAEIAKLTTASINEQERHDSYIKLAKILYLSGDIEGAASAWESAAYAVAEKRDDTALLESAECYVAMGEWDKSEAVVKLLLLTVRDDKNIYKRTLYLKGQIEAFQNGNTSQLDAIVNDKEYVEFRPAIYYTLWQVSGNEGYKTKLLGEFPNSPEAYSIGGGSVPRVSTLPSANWLLFPGRGKFGAVESSESNVLQSPVKTSRQTAAASITTTTSGQTVRSTNPAPLSYTGSRIVQTGIYKDKENAVLQVERLKSAGFNAYFSSRTIDGKYHWTVSVRIPSGSNKKNIIQRLKEHGFDALPSP
ncbi:MAG: tetratricopeptide repeat protein [Spirochaetaceae bacterium]|jgi:hypothetical protein|nr:tetratricopeptide repeat protein [Spirochaetaceae bacterium]